MTILHTPRIRLEPFDDSHLEGLWAIDQLPEVMRYITGEPGTRAQTAAWVSRVQRCWKVLGTSWWAFIEPGSGRVMGAGCIQYARRSADLPDDLDTLRSNPLEIGWRLHPDFWRRGLATEAAFRMADFAFQDLAAPELIAVRDAENVASGRVMDRLGMRYRGPENWYGQSVPTYHVAREDWLGRADRGADHASMRS